MRRHGRKVLSCASIAALVVSSFAVAAVQGSAPASAATTSSIAADQFKSPDMQFRPGVRWWWSGGAVETAVLGQQLDYLASRGFGTVEINPFGLQPATPNPDIQDVYTPAFYEKLEWAVAKAKTLGITVDLNMGSGWNANSQYVTIDDGERNLALGRSSLTGAQVKSGAISVPALAKSKLYKDPMPKFDASRSKLKGVLVARRTGTAGAITGDAAQFNDGSTVWDQRMSLDVKDSYYVDASKISGGSFTLDADSSAKVDSSKDYEIVAVYSLPAGSGAANGTTARPDWFVVDHMDAAKTLKYVNQWVGDENLKRIVDKYDNVRALFNDSLELGTDLYYTDAVSDLAKDAANNGLGYDFSKYLPTVYRQNLGLPAYFPTNTMSGSTTSYLTYTTNAGETNRILADYRTLVGQKFAEGLKGFKRGANSNGLLFRQQSYNPPMDMIGGAKYVDIPEEEQADEFRLITASSGANLYDRNLVTAEQFTLGLTPFQNSLDSLKVGIDRMATSGVNNFFYHGFSYPYGKGTAEYGENGWAAFPTIGVNMTEDNTLSKFFPDLNAYAARLNYLTQQGAPSKDVAVYAPFNTRAVATGATPTLNRNGYAWDVINDDSVQAADTSFKDGKLSVNGGKADYDALVVHTQTVPVKTMERLLALAEQGAPIIFFGGTPNAQAGYADGNYVVEDQKVANLATKILTDTTAAYNPTTAAALASTLKKVVDPAVTYAPNDEVRFVRRTLPDGGELTYIRNTATTANTITVDADEKYENYYWLDQKTGNIYQADVKDDTVTFTLDPGKDPLGSGATPAKPSNGIALLAEPAGVTIPAGDLTAGLPDGLNRVAPEVTTPVQPTSLAVTADNLDGVIGGAVTTETFTSNVLGNWKEPAFQGGKLRSVVSDGIYKATVNVDPKAGKKYVLNLGEVFTAATVKVNDAAAGEVIFAPYEVDITDQLKAGVNEVEIAVTPRKKNRYFPAATNTNGKYSMAAPQDAGLVGPITLLTGTDTTYTPPTTPMPTPPVTTPVTVTPSVSFKLSSSSIKVGKNAKASVVVRAKGVAAPTGTFAIKKGNKTLQTVTLRASDQGKRVFTLPKLPKGKHTLKIVYSGSSTVAGKTSVSRTLRPDSWDHFTQTTTSMKVVAQARGVSDRVVALTPGETAQA